MRIFPRSRCGTCLLAGTIWSAVSAGLWWTLPFMPRGELTLPVNSRLISICPSAGVALIERWVEPTSVAETSHQRLDVFDLRSRTIVANLLPNCDERNIVAASRGGLCVVLNVGNFENPQIVKLDLAKRIVEPISIDPELFTTDWRCTVSPDGRLAAFFDSACNSINVWSLADNRSLAVVSSYTPYEFSADGRSLAVLKDDYASIAVLDAETARIRGQITLSQIQPWMAEVRAAAGHANVAITSVYLHVVVDEDEDEDEDEGVGNAQPNLHLAESIEKIEVAVAASPTPSSGSLLV